MEIIVVKKEDLEQFVTMFVTKVKSVIDDYVIEKEKEKFLSPKEACKLFIPAISRPTLDSLCNKGLLNKYHIGMRVFFKYSELIDVCKTFKKYKNNHHD